MVLVDTSVWVDHFRNTNKTLIKLLHQGYVSCHPYIIGELAAGNLSNGSEILSLLKSLPESKVITLDEYLYFIKENSLMAKGMGFVDIHLLAACQISGLQLFTLDKKLKTFAREMNLDYHLKPV